MRCMALVSAMLLASAAAVAGMVVDQKDGAITVSEDGKTVFIYNTQPVQPPEGVDKNFVRSCYIHPLYGLDSEVMTQDFPSDHYHHRGVFWAWPECTVGDRKMDVWTLIGVRQRTEKVNSSVKDGNAVIEAANIWSFDDAPQQAMVRENIVITAHPAEDNGRAIDFSLKFTNVSDKDVTFLGALNKGYGGLCYRPDAHRMPFTFTTAKGVSPEDVLRLDAAWADVSFSNGKGGTSGVSIFQHPDNPGYPFPGWIFRHYGFLGASWPHEQTHKLAPNESFLLKYRMYVHKGGAADAKVAEKFASFSQK